MADWNLPTLSSTYANFLTELDNRLDDLVMGSDPAHRTLTNVPTNAIRWSSASSKWQKYNGTSWVDLATTFAENVSTANAWATGRTITLTGDATGTSGSWTGSSNLSFATTLATVNANVGQYGSASSVPVITVNGKGLITAVGTASLGTIATQDSSSVSITGGSISGTTLTLPSGAGSTTEGVAQWNGTSDLLTVGTGTLTKTMCDTDSSQTLTNKTLGSSCTWNGNDITYGYLTQGAGLSVLGVAGSASADLASIAAGTDGHVLRRSGTTLGFGTIATAALANDAVTYAKIQNVSATDRILGRATAGAGDVEEIACTSFARTLLDDGDAATARATLGAQQALASGTSIKTINGTSLLGSGDVAVMGIRGTVYPIPGTYTFNIPQGVTSVKVTVVGGGGGGGRGTDGASAGGGGGGGGVAIKYVSNLTPGGSVSVTVGAGGGSQAAGGTSSFGAYCTATGGGAGASSNSLGNGGAGGAGIDGDLNYLGGSGASAVADSSYQAGAGGATHSASASLTVITVPMYGGTVYTTLVTEGRSVFGVGGSGSNGSGNGSGGSGSRNGAATAYSGAPGLVIVEW